MPDDADRILPAQPSLDVTVGELGEHALIQRITARLPPAPSSVAVGIGDDAAVIEPDRGTLSVVTTDALVEGVHFERAFAPPAAIGFKGLAVSLSDLAAMGATPRYALLSLVLPPEFLLADLDALLDGLLELAKRHTTTLVGGNITRSRGPLLIEITAFGSVKRRRALTRAGAKVGDVIYVSGTIGGATAGLGSLQAGDGISPCRDRLLYPEPRVRLGMLLGRTRAASACIDLSDGLADGLRQLTTASGVGAIVDAERVPIQADARIWFEQVGLDPILAGLTGGEDYELLFTISPRARGRFAGVRRLVKHPPLAKIGIITKEPELRLRRNGQVEPCPPGYEHFK